jgi:imidazolonepropionase-like amidohydrolase
MNSSGLSGLLATEYRMIILKNARVLDANHELDKALYSIVIEGSLITNVSHEPVPEQGAEIIDVAGRTVMPGLIDCHVHVSGASGVEQSLAQHLCGAQGGAYP